MRKPDKTWEIPLWETNHSKERLIQEELMDFASYKLGYEMKELVDDPSRKAYKHFEGNQFFPDGNLSHLDYQPELDVWMLADFNRKPHCWALMHVLTDNPKYKQYLVFDELYSEDALTTEQANRMCDKLESWGISKVLLAGDNTSNQKSGNYGRTGKNDWDYVREIFDERGIAWKNELDVQNPKRKVRVDRVNNVIYAGKNGVRRLLINPRCEYTIRDYRYAVVNDKGLKIDDGDIGHMSDAVDYGIWRNEKTGNQWTYVM